MLRKFQHARTGGQAQFEPEGPRRPVSIGTRDTQSTASPGSVPQSRAAFIDPAAHGSGAVYGRGSPPPASAREGGVPVLKKSRWLLLKREENLKTEQRFRLRDLLRYNLKTVRGYLLKEAFQQLWDYNSPAWAGKFLDDWCRQVMRSRIEPMKNIARSLRQHRELILNYFRAQKLLSSGVVEGLNNKAKVTMRKSYGFRTFRCLELALYHSLGKLPEPESTHEFF